VQQGLAQLYAGWRYARDLKADRWEFAVALSALQTEGITENDLRWLLARGLVERGRSTSDDGKSRPFNAFEMECDRVVLTRVGVRWAKNMSSTIVNKAPSTEALVCMAPVWDSRFRVLSFGGEIVKRFRVPAPTQELILATFQEEQWPRVIDDPLPPIDDICPKRRLHDVVAALNRRQVSRLIHFVGTGMGNAVAWERVDALQIAIKATAKRR
jgi:hypothetical protein